METVHRGQKFENGDEINLHVSDLPPSWIVEFNQKIATASKEVEQVFERNKTPELPSEVELIKNFTYLAVDNRRKAIEETEVRYEA